MRSFDLLCGCFKDRTFQQAEFWSLISDRTDWDGLFKIAERERVLPALYACFKENDVLWQIPPEVAGFLSSLEQLHFERNQKILEDLAEVASLLNSVGIKPILLKGAAYFVTGICCDTSSRYLLDIDLLIPASQLTDAVEILLENGFESNQSDLFGRFRHHHPALQRPGSVAFELHSDLGLGICKSLLPAAEVFVEAIYCDLQGARVGVPSPTHLVAHLIMHSQIHHPYHERIWPPLRAMIDLALIRRRFSNEIDWSGIERKFRRVGQYGVLQMHLLQVRDVLGFETPFPIRLTGLNRVRWLRRRLLRSMPKLCLFDPFYLYSIAFTPRFRLSREVLARPGGWKIVLRTMCSRGIYKRIFTDIMGGSSQ